MSDTANMEEAKVPGAAQTSRRAVALVSGGLDSVAMAWALKDYYSALTVLTFDYGQKHVKEIGYAQAAMDQLGTLMSIDHRVVRLRDLADLLAGSALTDADVAVPEGRYDDESMKATVVPNRNSIFLSIAVGVAVSVKARIVATAVHAGDHAIYPDCRPRFVQAFDHVARLATEGFTAPGFRVRAPFVDVTKAQIIRLGQPLGVPWGLTWSCYKGGAKHCGKCGTCVERIEAFKLAEVADPTEYEIAEEVTA